MSGAGTGLTRIPGLVNAHTHAAMTLFRGYADDLPLMRWLEEHIWPAEKRLTDEDVYWGARLACLEMVRTGTVTFWDMYWHPGATARAARDAGLRAVIGAPLIDDGDPAGAARLRADAERSLEELAAVMAEPGGERISPALAPHAVYTVSEESLRWIAETSAERGLPVHIHLAETEGETANCVEAHGDRPAAYLDRLGLLGPRTVLAHGVWLDRDEFELIAERGATVVTNPVANLKLAVGRVFPYEEVRRAGCHVGIGTDGAGSNNSLDLFADLKTFALLQKNEMGDPAAVPAPEALAIARGERSPVLEPAADDHLLVRADAHELSLGKLDPGLVYAAGGSVVDTTVVAGETLMQDGVIEGAGEVVARARERAATLGLT